MISRILEMLEEEKSDWNNDYNAPIDRCKEIVQEVAKEYGKDINVRSNAYRIRNMTDEELARFLDEFDSVSGCDMCSIRGNCHAESNCIEGFLGWLKSEEKE